MEYELPKSFDLIVIGTGMVESIVAAAASRIGKTVLHIDSEKYYGGVWASFNLDAIEKVFSQGKCKESQNVEKSEFLEEEEFFFPIGNRLFDISDTSFLWHIPDKLEDENAGLVEYNNVTENIELMQPIVVEADLAVKEKDESKNGVIHTRETILKEVRRFNIDIAPKLHFARGDFVELLISSNIARYSEFRSVSRVLTWLNEKLEVVPCSRSDIFSSNSVSVIEKRMLMKLLTACMSGDENEFKGYETKTFLTYLKERKLSANLIHYVLYSIAMGTDETPCMQGVENTRHFLNSLGRFGKTPFLYSMYGSGEITQAFCRLSAVFGGVYVLSCPLNGFVFDKEYNFKALICNKQKVAADNVVMSIEKSPEHFVKSFEKNYISRGIFITDRSVMENEKEHLTLLRIPPENGKNSCTIIEMGCLTGTCPKDLYLVHMYAKQDTNPKEDLSHCVQKLFSDQVNVPDGDAIKHSGVKILWSCYYSVPDSSKLNLRIGLPKNVFLCPGPDLDLDLDQSIKQAKLIFTEMYPDLEFLPRAPDPEEIIIGNDSNSDHEEEVTNNVHDSIASEELPKE